MHRLACLLVALISLETPAPKSQPPPKAAVFSCTLEVRINLDAQGHHKLTTECAGPHCAIDDPCADKDVNGVHICDCGSDVDSLCCETDYSVGGFGQPQPCGAGSCPVPCCPPPCDVRFIPDDPTLPPKKQTGEWAAICGC